MNGAATLLEGMGTGQLERVVVGKLGVDIDLLEGIRELVKKQGIRTGIILAAAGALSKAVFRNLKAVPPDYKINDSHRLYLELEQPLELVSLSGWIATKTDGEAEVHLHFSASTVIKDQIVTLGGHLIPGTLTSVKVVVVVGVLADSTMKASIDPRTGQIEVDLS